MRNVRIYFPEDQDPEDIEIHGIAPWQEPEFTLCSIAWEEWDCKYDFNDRLTEDPITCENCIDVLEQINKSFVKTEKGWIAASSVQSKGK